MPRHRTALAFTIAVAVLALGAAVVAAALHTQTRDWEWVLHTRETLERLQAMRAQLADAVVEQRGLLLTHDAHYQRRLEAAERNLLQQVADFKTLTADNPRQQAAADALRARIQDYLARLAQVVRVDGEAARDPRVLEDANEVRDAVLRQLGMMRAEEERLLALRNADVDRARVLTILAVGSFCIVAVGLMAYIRNLVHRDAARIRELLAQRQLALDAAGLGWWRYDIGRRVSSLDERFRAIWGIDEASVPTETVWSRILPEDAPAARAAVDATLRAAGEQAYEAEYRIRRPDGAVRWIEARGEVQLERGRPIALIGTVRDITERKTAERALVESEERFRMLADNMSQLAWIADGDGSITWYNKRWYDYTGTDLEQMRGWGWTKAHHPEHLQRVVERISHSFATGEPWEDTFPLRGRDGEYRWFLSRAVPIRGADGRVERWFGTNTDITEQRRAEAALAELNRSLEQRVEARTRDLQAANEEMEAFTYSVSHDLRAPLRGIHGYAQALEEDFAPVLQDEGRLYLKRIAASAARMDDLIQDLLAYSRLGREELLLAPVDTDTVVATVVQSLRPAIGEAKGEVTIDAPLPPVIGTRSILLQVVQNLVANAIKFVPPATPPRLRIHAQRSGAFVRLAFDDNGIGVDPRHSERIFRVFERLHGADAYPGTGIGLAIVKKGVERMKGRCGVEPREGGGSRFWIELPAAGQRP